jgi:hypothetical protein
MTTTLDGRSHAVADPANPIHELWAVLGRLTPERRAVINQAYAEARRTAGDAEASRHVLGPRDVDGS